MAQPTSEHAHPTGQAPTPGITPGSPAAAAATALGNRAGLYGGASMAPAADHTKSPTLDPVLFTDVEPVHFVRLYPEAVAKGKAGTAEALAAGKAVQEAGKKLQAAQQEPPNYEGEAAPAPKK